MDRKGMNWDRFKEPTFIAAAASCVLLVALIISRNGSGSPSTGVAAERPEEFNEAVSIAETHLNKGEFEPAFDMVMVASRVAPSDPRLFDLVMSFVEKAKSSKDEDVVAMADDLLDRGDSLVHFQSPKKVASARKRLSEIRQSSIGAAPPTPPQPLFESVRKLIDVAESKSLPIAGRSKAAEQARNALDDALLDQALSPLEQTGPLDAPEVKELQSRIDSVEKQCVTELFLQAKTRIDLWLNTASSLTKESDNAPSDEVPMFSKRLTDLLSQGFDQLQEITPYSKSGVEGASDYARVVEKQIKALQRSKTWLYNQQTLRLVREIEAKNDLSLDDKIRHLAEVSEELLSPYVLRRHNELWDKVFEELPDEDKKAWAVRLRIQRLNE
jgi:hypothetical protein